MPRPARPIEDHGLKRWYMQMSDADWQHHLDHHATAGHPDTCPACEHELRTGDIEDTRA